MSESESVLPRPAAVPAPPRDFDPHETSEWREALDQVVAQVGAARARELLGHLAAHATGRGVGLQPVTQTPYVNTIPVAAQPAYPGDLAIERRLRAIIRWNAVMMVSRANKTYSGIGGHISSYASSANLYEMGFNHFFRGPDAPGGSDLIYYQGHASPGMYARAFLEGRLTREHLEHFRRETGGGGLPSYPHPWLLPDFWQFPTVSMGLGPIHAIYQARFNRYLHNRGLKDTSGSRVWAFLGDGECDEPETTGALGVAAREGLGNLTFVINCNLQRLDGPVRGNGKIIQDLEGTFAGAGWDVVKVVWGEEWDPLFAQDDEGLLAARLGAVVDGEYQKWTVADGATLRAELFGTDPRLLAMVEGIGDEALVKMRRGGHSDVKLHAAYARAVASDKPTCILAKTVKGWTLGGGFEASNVTHQMKKLDAKQLKAFRDRLELPIADADLAEAPYYRPDEKSPELAYLRERRAALGGSLPARRRASRPAAAPRDGCFEEFMGGGKAGQEVSTTMAFVRLLRALMRDDALGKHVVPIVPDEARTFGMDPFFREFGIYAPHGQSYVPVDAKLLLRYHEAKEGQLLEEGITEAGSMASFIAAGTAHSTHDLQTIPFYIYYSMFGMQRVGDQVWAAGDSRTRGFLCGATAGRTTLHGEGLQHDDGHSQLLAMAVPNLRAYDPAFAYETAIIVKDGLRRMLVEQEDVFYYLTLYNENYLMPPCPPGVEEGILRGIYRLTPSADAPGSKAGRAGKAGKSQKAPKADAGGKRVHLWASGPQVQTAHAAQELLRPLGVEASIWSVTSYQQLFRDARACERRARLAPEDAAPVPYVRQVLGDDLAPVVAVSDWIQEIPSLLARFLPGTFVPLGTNGFGRSDTREALRAHFEIDAPSIAQAAIFALMKKGELTAKQAGALYKKLGVRPRAEDPMDV